MGKAISGALGSIDPLDLTGQRKRREDNELRNTINDTSGVSDLFRITDQNGNLQDRFSQRAQNQNAFGGDALRRLATGSGLTDESQAALNQQRFQGRQDLNNLAARGQSNLNSSISALASRGGVRGGSRERLAGRNIFNQLQAGQQQRLAGQAAELGLRTSDANLRRRTLQDLNTQDRSAIGNDLTNTINDNRSFNEQQRLEEANRREALLNLRNRPKGGLGGTVSNLLGGIFG